MNALLAYNYFLKCNESIFRVITYSVDYESMTSFGFPNMSAVCWGLSCMIGKLKFLIKLIVVISNKLIIGNIIN